jgi:hypothetical protein
MEQIFNEMVNEYNRRVAKGCSKDYCQRAWKKVAENYDPSAEWARFYNIRHKEKTITCTKGMRGRPNYTKQHIIWNVPEIRDNSVAYLLHIFFEDTMEFWASKVGTAEFAQRRFQEEIDGYTKMTGRQMQIHVQMCEPCHSMAATIACESRMRDFYIRRYEENFVPNDRFEGVVIDPRQAKRIAKVW